MSYKQTQQDFTKVLSAIFKNNPKRSLNPLRCHEMARLISIGMNGMGYETTVQNGSYQGRFNSCQHSWVLCDNLYLSYFFVKNLDQNTQVLYHNEITRFFWQKWRYIPRQINHPLAEGIEDFAEEAFSSLKPN